MAPPLAPGFKRPANDDEALAAVDIIDRAKRERRVIRVQYFREADGRWFKDSLDGMFGRRKKLASMPVWREFEPVNLEASADGHLYAVVINPDPMGGGGPAYRTLRLDRIAVDRNGLRLTITRQPFKVTDTALDPAWHGVR